MSINEFQKLFEIQKANKKKLRKKILIVKENWTKQILFKIHKKNLN